MERTFIIIKPDAIKRGLVGRIISRFEDKDFKIVGICKQMMTMRRCQLMYGHVPKEVFNDLVAFMTSSPVIGILLEGDFAIHRVREIIGPTNSTQPGTIRGDFGTYPVTHNCIHASDSAKAVDREASLFFEGYSDAY